MARDPEMYDYARRYPGGLLALIGVDPGPGCAVESVAVKAQSRTLDFVFTPAREGAPVVYLEYQAGSDPQTERSFLVKVVNHCAQTGRFEGVRVVVIYARREHEACLLAADVGDGSRRAVPFTPERLVLQEVAPEEVARLGGEALALLPLVGEAKLDLEEARRRLELLVSGFQGRPPDEQEALLDSFWRFVRWRNATMKLETVMEQLSVVRKLVDEAVRKAEAQAEARGEARGEARLLEGLLRERLAGHEQLEGLIQRAGVATAEVLERAGVLVVRLAKVEELVLALDELLPRGDRPDRGASGL